MRNIACSFALGSVVLLSGCASMQAPTPVSPMYFHYMPLSQREDIAQAITTWDVSGSFSLTQYGKTHLANYTWHQQGQRFDIVIRSSLNLVGAHIKGRAGHARLYRGDKAPIEASSPEALMQKALGYSLPVRDLAYWVKGVPAPKQYKAKFDQFGHITSLSQDGWQITMSHYTRFKKADVPRILSFKRPGLAVKIVLRYWSE